MTGHDNAVGDTEAQLVLEEEMAHLASTDAKVLITGSAAHDPHAAARSIHARSLRAAEPFVTVRCSDISESRLEQELFGDRPKGAVPALQQADGGTLFLDDIGEMTLNVQARLLHFLETGEVRPLGGELAGRVNVRVIAGTRRNLHRALATGRFREDLFYRLNIVHIVLPPNRES